MSAFRCSGGFLKDLPFPVESTCSLQAMSRKYCQAKVGEVYKKANYALAEETAGFAAAWIQ